MERSDSGSLPALAGNKKTGNNMSLRCSPFLFVCASDFPLEQKCYQQGVDYQRLDQGETDNHGRLNLC